MVGVLAAGDGATFVPLADDGAAGGPVTEEPDLAGAVAARESGDRPRWLWPSTAELYPRLLRASVRVERAYDLELAEALLLGAEGRWGEPRSVAAAYARLHGADVPRDPAPRSATQHGDRQAALFETDTPAPVSVEALVETVGAQRTRCAAVPEPGRMRTLIAVESAGALAAAEMGHVGLPWRADVHDALLLELLGEPSPVGPPRRLAQLAEAINVAFGQRVHPESPAEVLRAFSRVGITLPNTRAWQLRRVDHPAVPLLLEYKELFRIWTAHGWSWREQWVRDGRFRAEYVPAGVVSGRWASRGGGALQIPKVIRRAVIADPQWTFVVADAGQLEPRVLAAVSGDERLAQAAGTGDLYAALASEAFDGDRARAKVALLGAMYGQTGGQAVPALAALRRFYPTAWDYVESAARIGETGGLVRSWLGRTCPPPSVNWWTTTEARFDPEEAGTGVWNTSSAARARGRFTRNFVIQATAAEWALVLIARLRSLLAGTPAELVFFQHDEVVVHCPVADAPAVVEAVHQAGDDARRLLFGDTTVRFPLDVSTVECYADAK
jgi:DNA polymerase I